MADTKKGTAGKEVKWEWYHGGLYAWRKDVASYGATGLAWTLDLGIVMARIFVDNQRDEGYTISIHGIKDYVSPRLVKDIDKAKEIAALMLYNTLTEAVGQLDALDAAIQDT